MQESWSFISTRNQNYQINPSGLFFHKAFNFMHQSWSFITTPHQIFQILINKKPLENALMAFKLSLHKNLNFICPNPDLHHYHNTKITKLPLQIQNTKKHTSFLNWSPIHHSRNHLKMSWWVPNLSTNLTILCPILDIHHKPDIRITKLSFLSFFKENQAPKLLLLPSNFSGN